MTAEEIDLNKGLAGKMPFIKTVVAFTRAVTDERGRLLRRTTGFGYVHTIRNLHNFGDFSFYADIGQSTLGGNRVKVWYHPGSRYGKGLTPVFDVWWPLEVEECRLTKLDSDQKWQKDMRRIIERKKAFSMATKPAKDVPQKPAKDVPPKRALTKFEEEMREQHHIRKLRKLYAL